MISRVPIHSVSMSHDNSPHVITFLTYKLSNVYTFVFLFMYYTDLIADLFPSNVKQTFPFLTAASLLSDSGKLTIYFLD